MKFRSFDAADHEACMALFDSNMDPYFTTEERPLFDAFLKKLDPNYYVIENPEGNIVACGGFHVDDKGEASFVWGMSRRDLHGHGLGKMLTRERLARIKDDPRTRSIRLDTSQHTTGFYEKFGFEIIQIIENGYGPNLHKCEMRLTKQDP